MLPSPMMNIHNSVYIQSRCFWIVKTIGCRLLHLWGNQQPWQSAFSRRPFTFQARRRLVKAVINALNVQRLARWIIRLFAPNQ
jgi:hypothetical protein